MLGRYLACSEYLFGGGMNISTIPKQFSDEAAAWEQVEKMRWPNGLRPDLDR